MPAEFSTIYLIPLLALAALLALLLYFRRQRSGELSLDDVIDEIAFERIEALVLPNGDEGEIQIDHLLLTAQGLLIIDVKNAQGAVFGSDKMQDWAVISKTGRFTFNNPIPALLDRIAAVKHIVREVPVNGRILFLEGANFEKGVPERVCSLQQLRDEFGEPDKSAAKFKVDAFRQHWETLRANAILTGS